jgi:hypothetical protein
MGCGSLALKGMEPGFTRDSFVMTPLKQLSKEEAIALTRGAYYRHFPEMTRHAADLTARNGDAACRWAEFTLRHLCELLV